MNSNYSTKTAINSLSSDIQADINAALSSPTSTENIYLSSPTLSNTSSSIGSWFSSISMTTWLIVVLVLAFLGFNIFIYLAKGTQDISNFFGPLFKKMVGFFGMTAAATTKQVTDVSATGAKATIDVAAGTVTSGVDVLGQTATTSANASATSNASATAGATLNTTTEENNMQNNILNQALNSSQGQGNGELDYQADDSYSTIQQSKSANKAGWCYIGEDRGYRTCMKVGNNDTCMSGDIFPSQDICVNPSLRV